MKSLPQLDGVFLILIYYFFLAVSCTKAHRKYNCHTDNHSQPKLITYKPAYSGYILFSSLQKPYSQAIPFAICPQVSVFLSSVIQQQLHLLQENKRHYSQKFFSAAEILVSSCFAPSEHYCFYLIKSLRKNRYKQPSPDKTQYIQLKNLVLQCVVILD